MRMAIAAGALAALIAAVPALAQDSPRGPGGFYAGPLAGVDITESDGESESGIVYGATVGYDFSSGPAIFGVEAEMTDSSIEVDERDLLLAGDRLSVGAGLDFYLGARAGMRVGQGGLLYVKAGYTELDIDVEYDDGVDSFSETEPVDGYRLGLGGEFPVGRRMAARIEYRYSNYSSGNFDADDLDDAIGSDLERHQGVATLLFRF